MQTIVTIDGEIIHTDTSNISGQMLHIGEVKAGQQVDIYLQPDVSNGLGKDIYVQFQFAQFNEEVYEQAYEKLSQNVYQIDVYESNYVKGSICADQDGIMMTSIPAMDGFEVLVDGDKAEYAHIADALIGVPLKAGTHTVEFKYMTPYFKEGLAGSLCGVFIFVVICVVEQMRKKKNAVSENSEIVE
jgi:hypothetical protein